MTILTINAQSNSVEVQEYLLKFEKFTKIKEYFL